nr:monovalent cation/H+ antiporter complex subunit F [Gluconacetobacter tumulisoli]
MQMASFLSAAILVLVTFAQGEPSFMDLPLALVLLGLPGSLLIASFYDRFL